jgi:plasmid maintenance system antidote protein VapI
LQSIQEITKLYDRSMQLWTNLQEDEKLQQLEQKEEGVNTTVQELKKRKKAMNISDRLKSAQELKNLADRAEEHTSREVVKAG